MKTACAIAGVCVGTAVMIVAFMAGSYGQLDQLNIIAWLAMIMAFAILLELAAINLPDK